MYPKPRPAALDRADRRKVYARLDKAQNTIVKVRSGGRCEARLLTGWADPRDWNIEWCNQRATEIHHMLGGRYRSRIIESAMAEHKQHLCTTHHRGITGEVGGKRFARVGGPVPHWADSYRRLR